MRRLWTWWRDFKVMVRGLERLRTIGAPEPVIRAAWEPLNPRKSMAWQWETLAQAAIQGELLMAKMAARLGVVLGAKPQVDSDRFVRAKLDPIGPYR
jgi:hypothetical protein